MPMKKLHLARLNYSKLRGYDEIDKVYQLLSKYLTDRSMEVTSKNLPKTLTHNFNSASMLYSCVQQEQKFSYKTRGIHHSITVSQFSIFIVLFLPRLMLKCL